MFHSWISRIHIRSEVIKGSQNDILCRRPTDEQTRQRPPVGDALLLVRLGHEVPVGEAGDVLGVALHVALHGLGQLLLGLAALVVEDDGD